MNYKTQTNKQCKKKHTIMLYRLKCKKKHTNPELSLIISKETYQSKLNRNARNMFTSVCDALSNIWRKAIRKHSTIWIIKLSAPRFV